MIEKYTAGIIDADGSIGLHFNKRKDGTHRAAIRIKLNQTHGDTTFIAEEFNLNIHNYVNAAGNESQEIYAFGDRALTALMRFKNHLRIKRHLAEWAIRNHGKVVDNPKNLKKEMQQVRKDSASMDKGRPPSKAWMAGYFDGDGNVNYYRKTRGHYETYIRISAWTHDKPILDMLAKQFGGKVYRKGKAECYEWSLYCTKKQVHPAVSHMLRHVRFKRHRLDEYVHRTRND